MEKLLRIKSNELPPEKGRVLIAEPFMDDFYFGRSVVLLIDHSHSKGTFGMVMNKLSGAMLNDIVKDFPTFEAPVYLGGPVQTDTLFFMHTLGNQIPDSEEILPGLYWGGDIAALQEMMTLRLVNKEQLRFFLGYSGWDARQLAAELKRNSWVVSEASAPSLLKTKSHQLWNHFMQRMGPAYDLWRFFPVDPELN